MQAMGTTRAIYAASRAIFQTVLSHKESIVTTGISHERVLNFKKGRP